MEQVMSIFKSFHPGKKIAEMLEKYSMSQKELAVRTGVTEKHISTVISGQKNISPTFAQKLEYALGFSATEWLALQAEYDTTLLDYEEKQHFTQPLAHYTEASLVKNLEELGIGRPSTYSPTITTLLKRRYITKEGRNIFMTEIGDIVNSIMMDSFPNIVDVNFTANMESQLDGVESGSVEWKSIMRNLYPDLDAAVKKAEKELEKVTIKPEVSDVICENCGVNMIIRYGKNGKFLGCPNFPECRNVKSYYEKIGVTCPACGGNIVIKRSKKGRIFYGCDNYPDCDFISWSRPVDEKCPRCGGYMTIKGKKLACFDAACGFTKDITELDH